MTVTNSPNGLQELAMPTAENRTLCLSAGEVSYIDGLVSSGVFATASDVIVAGLKALQDRDASVDKWLTEEVVPTAERMRQDPTRAVSADDVFAEIRKLHFDER